MPWTANSAPRFTKKAKSPKAKRQWSHVADSTLARTGDEGQAIRAANAVAKSSAASTAAARSTRRPTRSHPRRSTRA